MLAGIQYQVPKNNWNFGHFEAPRPPVSFIQTGQFLFEPGPICSLPPPVFFIQTGSTPDCMQASQASYLRGSSWRHLGPRTPPVFLFRPASFYSRPDAEIQLVACFFLLRPKGLFPRFLGLDTVPKQRNAGKKTSDT